MLAFSGAWLWLRRREQAAADAAADGSASSLDRQPQLGLMDQAMAAGDSELFFKAARAALQRDLATKWRLSADAITFEEVAARLGAHSAVARLFSLADETAYAGVELTALEFRRWMQLVLDHINSKAVS
jgi:hypothetical protein